MVEYSMIQHDPGTLAASALYLANAVEKRKIQKRSHQNSTHSLGTTQMNSKEQTLDSNISKLAQEVKLSESDIKRCALEINIIAGSHEQ